ncbi:MAG TPA: c-type cytochrome [Marinobacterium sp.]|nr:c-type cytochrome [Marinobacterium sp.]
MKNLVISTLLSLGLVSGAQAAGDATAGEAKTLTCAGCHGADGNSMVPNFPKLAGLGEKYLLKQLNDVKSGNRVIVEMTGILDNLNDQDLQDIAAFYASKKIQGGQADPALAAIGEEIYRAGDESKGLAACAACHGPAGGGVESAAFPALAGQHAAYIESTLVKFSKGERANDPNQMMRGVAAKMSEADMKAVAQYIQGLYK